jgi:hypothetical protein
MALSGIYTALGLGQGLASAPQSFSQGQAQGMNMAMNLQKMDLGQEQLMAVKSQRERVAQAMKDAEQLEIENEEHNKTFLDSSRRWATKNTTGNTGSTVASQVNSGMGAKPTVARQTLESPSADVGMGADSNAPLSATENEPTAPMAKDEKTETVTPPSTMSMRQSAAELSRRWLRLYTLTGDERYKTRAEQVIQSANEGFKNILTGAFLAGNSDVVSNAIFDIYGVKPNVSFGQKDGQTVMKVDLGKGMTMDLSMAQVLNLDNPQNIAAMEWTMEQKRQAYQARLQNTQLRVNANLSARMQLDALNSAPYFYLVPDNNGALRKVALMNSDEAEAMRENGHQVFESKSQQDRRLTESRIATSQQNVQDRQAKQEQDRISKMPYYMDDGSGIKQPIGQGVLQAILKWKSQNPNGTDAELQSWLDAESTKHKWGKRIVVTGLKVSTSKEQIDATGKTITRTHQQNR